MAFTYDENIFSDLHKDARGFRPRGHEFYTATPERKQEIWDAMLVELEDEIENERRGQIAAQRRFEELVTETIAVGVEVDRDTAIRWILEAEGIDGYDAADGGEYVCYHFGMCYGLKEQFQPYCDEILARDGNPYFEAEA